MDKLLIALDVDTGRKALDLADSLRDLAGGFKIGSRLFTNEGPALVRALVKRGDRVFLDLKYHDIPSVVGSALRAASGLGVWMATIHTTGGLAMMRAAKEAAGDKGTLVVGVTVLTSFSQTTLTTIGVPRQIEDQVDAMAELAAEAGIDGVVASPLELPRLRKQQKPDFLIVTPGIRKHSQNDDQTRTLSAQKAIQAGASYLVVGRPIIEANDPRKAAEVLCEEMANA
jgi:orotidine-5'-phosphate decarboxylase